MVQAQLMEQLVAGKSAAQLDIMSHSIEKLAEAKAAAEAQQMAALKQAAAAKKVALAKQAGATAKAGTTVAAKGTATGVASTTTASTTAAKAGSATIWNAKGLSLGLGMGLGAWGPVLLIAGGTAGYFAYKKYFTEADEMDEIEETA